jgi:hypothetical protein
MEVKESPTNFGLVEITRSSARSVSDLQELLDVLVPNGGVVVARVPHGLSVQRVRAAGEALLLAVVEDGDAGGDKG